MTQAQLGYQPFQFAVLLAQLPQLAQLAQTQTGMLLLPQINVRTQYEAFFDSIAKELKQVNPAAAEGTTTGPLRASDAALFL